jgi:hypothetical protein
MVGNAVMRVQEPEFPENAFQKTYSRRRANVQNAI